jgi:hypothetical protein
VGHMRFYMPWLKPSSVKVALKCMWTKDLQHSWNSILHFTILEKSNGFSNHLWYHSYVEWLTSILEGLILWWPRYAKLFYFTRAKHYVNKGLSLTSSPYQLIPCLIWL